MNWIKLSEQKPQDFEYVLFGKHVVFGGDKLHEEIIVANLGSYNSDSDEIKFVFKFDGLGTPVGVHKFALSVFEPNSATHWMTIPNIPLESHGS